jgi:hypothetical protein
VIAIALVVRAAWADTPGAESLTRGIQAFEQHNYALAAAQFDNALGRGGLSRAQTLTVYVDLGVAYVALGKTKQAQQAFETAALIDPKFVVPPSSGPRAEKLANQARQKEESVGQYHFDVGVPGDLKAQAPFKITVEMPEDEVPLVPLVRIAAQEPGGKSFETFEPSVAHLGVEIPAEVAVSGETITLRVELLDRHNNRLAVTEKLLKVEEPAQKPEPGPEKPVKPEPEQPVKLAKPEPPEDGEAEEGPWSIPHGSKKYTAVRADHAPSIDGLLDDAIWQQAPKDTQFMSTKSKPFGQPTKEPTTVQVAYDDKNLYVAFHCTYSKPRGNNDSYSGDEQTLISESENVTVLVDAVHGHTGAYQFAVSPAGVRADAEISDQGAAQNLDWHGIWEVATAFTADGWTAEFSIPWGTMYMPASDDAFDVGINFTRHEPVSGETELWALHPPATELYDTNFFGHLDGLAKVYPGQRLLILPFFAAAFDSNPTAQSQLTDLTGGAGSARIYAGVYLRLRPPGPFRLDATFNPDFSAVTPDATLANFDRFELEYPEARPFFAEDAPRFQFGGTRYLLGDVGAQLFYSRRLGILTNNLGLTQIVPILWGVKSVLRAGGTEAAVMNVETVAPKSGVSLSDNATIGRVTQTIEGQRVGAIVLERTGASGSYTSEGADAQLSLYDRHLQIGGFFAGSQVTGATSSAGEGTVAWKSQDVYAKATLLDIGKAFQAPLGYFPITGATAETIAAGYTPVVRSDLVQQVFLDTELQNVRDRDDDSLIYRRAAITASFATIDGAIIGAGIQPSTENVTTAFPIGNGRIMVPVGVYKVLGTQFDVTSPPNRTFVFAIHYNGGDLYDGTRNSPGVMMGLNLGRLTARASYYLYILKFTDQNESFYGHDAAITASYAFTPLAKTTLVLEADTVAARGTAQLVTTYQFGSLSALTLSVRGQSGSTLDTEAQNAFDNPNLTAILSLAIGASPF